ncbi:ABC transporter substrate-binding protein, partial [Micromonospora sp. M42]|uniref:ABC transporter substrate-binding protein n=1 Tax=Micromonospora sp. M42 TaxID=457406 RepID=UPI0018DB8333
MPSCSPRRSRPAAGTTSPPRRGADGLTTVRLASSPLGHLAPIYLAQEQGIFAKHGLKVEVDTETSDLTSVPAVLAGKVDFATGDLTTLIVARSKGLDV